MSKSIRQSPMILFAEIGPGGTGVENLGRIEVEGKTLDAGAGLGAGTFGLTFAASAIFTGPPIVISILG